MDHFVKANRKNKKETFHCYACDVELNSIETKKSHEKVIHVK